MIFDTHAHYDDKRFDEDRDSLLCSMPQGNVGLIVNSCASMKEVNGVIGIAEKYPFVYATVGVHPEGVEEMSDTDIETLRALANHEKVVGIGEIGLDYHYDDIPKETQQIWFRKQIELAKECKMPIVIHDRDAHKDCMDILREHDIRDIGGEFHCYSGSVEMAREILDWGMYLGFGGVLTFKNAHKTVDVAKYAPLDRILLETDAPYLAPTPHRGERNDSTLIKYVAERLAEIKGISVEEVERITFENGKRLFGI